MKKEMLLIMGIKWIGFYTFVKNQYLRFIHEFCFLKKNSIFTFDMSVKYQINKN